MKLFASSLCLALLGSVAAVIPIVNAQAPAAAPLPPRATPPKIVLKLDDMVDARQQWRTVLDMINKRGIKASFGIICNSLENPKPDYVQFIKDTRATGKIEYWCHGYDHKSWTENGLHMEEFLGPSYDQQKQHLQKCQQLAREKLGFTFDSLGTPFNSYDEKTAQVLRDDGLDFKVWIYGDKQFPEGKQVLVRYGDVNIENPIFHPSTERLMAGMAKHANAPYFVIQGHPPQWDAPRMAEFEKMLDYLVSIKSVFVTPSELAASLPPVPPADHNSPLPPPVKLQPAAPAPVAAAAAKPVPAGTPTGDNLIENGDFARGEENWNFQKLANAAADYTVEDNGAGKKVLHVKVPVVAEKRYYIQFAEKAGFRVFDGKSYTVSFRARSVPAAKVIFTLPAAGAPEPLVRQDNIALTEEWKDYTFTVAPGHPADLGHFLMSGLGATAADYWFSDFVVKVNQ